MGFFGQDKAIPLSSAYKVGTQYPLDVRQTVESEEDLWSLSVWGSYKSLKNEWGFSMYPNMLVGIANTNIVYQLNGPVPQITDKDATRFPEGTWHKLATQEWVLAQEFGSEIPEHTYDVYGSAEAAETNAKAYTDAKVGALYTKDDVDGLIQEAKDYADNNDADTKYGIEYDSITKTIKLVKDGTETEIDASDFIKDGMLSSVIADQDNNKLTFYWNTVAGIEHTEIALSSIADIYTGVEGDDITVSVSNENKISATLAEAIKTAIENGTTAYDWGDHAQAGYVKTADLGALAYEDSLSAAAIGAYTKEEVDSQFVKHETKLTSIKWSEDLATNKIDLSGTIIHFNTNSKYGTPAGVNAWPVYSTNLFKSSGGYIMTVLAPPSIVFKHETKEVYEELHKYNSDNGGEWLVSELTLPEDFGYISEFFAMEGSLLSVKDTIASLNIMTTSIENVSQKAIIVDEISYFVHESGTLATQEWVRAQDFGTSSGSIDTTKFVTLDKEQTISGNKTFTGEVDFSDATVKGLAIDPADVDLAGYATEDWVKSQGYVTASYLDNILTFSTSGSEVSAVNYSNDEVLFTEDLYVTNPMGDFVSGDNVKGLSLQEIITRLLKLETNI